jgi:hypothetical protein
MHFPHCEPGSNLQKDIAACLTGTGHLDEAKTAQQEMIERFIGTELPKRMKTLPERSRDG